MDILQNLRKREGTCAGLQGFLYEIQIILLFMIRSCLNNIKFTLVNNADEFGNFDDLVALCVLGDGTEVLICLQSKHLKESENKIDLNRFKGIIKKYIEGNEKDIDDKSFKLKKYCEEILMSKISNYNDINVKFIFYTTVAISETDTDLQWCNIDNKDILCLLLDTSGSKNCVRRFSDTGNKQILGEIENDTQFLEKICIFSNQCHESNFDKIIKDELEKLLGTKNEDITNKVYTQFINILLEWYKNANLIPFNNDKFLDMVWQFLFKEIPCLSTKYNIYDYEKLSKDYKDNNMASLKKDIEVNQIVTVKTVEKTTVLPAIEVYKAVSEITSECVRTFVIVKLQKLGQVLKLFENVIDYLIIEVDCVEKFNNDLKLLYVILAKKKWKKVVFLVPNSIKFDIPILQNVKVGEHEYKFDFDSLSTDTQNYVLSCNIKFQGNEMPLSGLVDAEDACCVLDYETVEKLIQSETVNIGEKLKKRPKEIEHCYIPRSFHCKNVVSSKIFDMKSDSDILLVSVISEDHLRKNKRHFVHYENINQHNANSGIFYHRSYSKVEDENAFKHFAAKLKEKNVHWLQENKNNLVWLETKGSLEKIQQYVQTCTFNGNMITQKGASEDILLESGNKLNVLLDSAGKGKTITLYKIAEQLKLKNKNCWVLHYDLNSQQMIDILYEISENEQFGEMNAKQLIVRFFLCTKLEISVFNVLLKKSKIYFCFDGLDEISPRYENTCIALVKKLNQSSTKQIWLTSREHMEKSLQNNFPVFSIKLLPISVEDQINFCVKYYTYEFNNGETYKKKIEQFSKILIKSLSYVNATILEFMGIPLLTKMLASINLEQCKKYLNNTHEEANNLPKTFENIFDLYQMFFENAIKRYLTEKECKDLKGPRLFLKKEIEKIQKLHMSIATKSLLPEHYSKMITEQEQPDRLASDQETKLLGIGIINSLEKDNTKFLHFTFAEFMLANSLLVNLSKIQNPSELQIILDEVLHNDRWKVVRKFLNFSTLLAANLSTTQYNPTATNIPEIEGLYNRWKFVRKFRNYLTLRAANLSNTQYNPTATNISQYELTSLVIALREGNRNIAQRILQCLEEVNKADAKTWICKHTNRHGKTALYIAIDKEYKEEISLLLDYGANIEEEIEHYGTPLMQAVSKGNLEIISLLLACGANIYQRDRLNKTAILEAASSSTPEVLDLLLAEGANLEDKGKDGKSLLMYAARNNRNDTLVHVLGKVQWDVNYKDSEGYTALHKAARSVQCLNIKTLLDHDADINSQNLHGETPLHLAVKCPWYYAGSPQRQLCAKYLIKKGARTDITNNEGKSVLETSILIMSKHKNLREWIEKDNEHDSIHDLEQQLKNKNAYF